MATPTINDMMAAYAEDAIDFAFNNFGISLDYTNESVRQVEAMAETLAQSRPKNFVRKLFRKSPSDEELQTVCKMLGGYIGEVYRRAKGGTWEINEQFQALGVHQEENWVFPPAKVHKRLTNGAEDNLWSYFNVLLAEPWGKGEA
jgi:hypothetical protein